MSLMVFSLSKEVSFQGRTERFSNVYTYDMSSTSEASLNTVIDNLIAAERPVHGDAVSFVEARAYTTWHLQGLSDIGSTYIVRPISNTFGTVPVGSNIFYREMAFLLKWPLPRKVGITGSLGRQRSLKKWIHACVPLGLSANVISGISPVPAVAALTAYGNAVATNAGNPLCSPDGTLPTSTVPVLHPWIEHRQFPRGRKE